MILTVTLNAALDVTYELDRMTRHGSTRVQHVHSQAGGKGLNVARTLARLGSDVRVTGLVGGCRGQQIRHCLSGLPLDDQMVEIAGESRQTVAVVEAAGDPTELDEPGPLVSDAEWAHFKSRYAETIRAVAVVVLSGSLPPGIPLGGYAELIEMGRDSGCTVILDAAGSALLAGTEGGPDIVAPNRRELLGSLDEPAQRNDVSLVEAARALQARGAGAVVASLGPSGLLASTPVGLWRCRHPKMSGNPLGAGDALVAGLARGLELGLSWPDLLVEAAAAAMASVRARYAGEFEPESLPDLARQVRISRIETTTA